MAEVVVKVVMVAGELEWEAEAEALEDNCLSMIQYSIKLFPSI